MIYRIDPFCDRRWEPFVQEHPHSSIFHTSGWLEALRRTYGYEPVVYTTSPPQGELTNGVVFCKLSSWLTGKRLVSLPFSDHCDPLLERESSGSELFGGLCAEQSNQSWKRVEFRPRRSFAGLRPLAIPSQTYCFHNIDLSPSAESLFAALHPSCTQRTIRRAEREKLLYRDGLSADLLSKFYDLVLMTRKRHGVPPQPFLWFQNLAACLGQAMGVRLAMAGETPVAGVVTLRFRDVLIMKYAASDARFSKLGGTQWLIWRMIKEAKDSGLQEIDLGRSDWDNQGLITFKDRLGAKRLSLSYWRYPGTADWSSGVGAFKQTASWIVGHTPFPILALASRRLYRHIG